MSSDKEAVATMQFATQEDWSVWLAVNHASSPGVWLCLAKKASGVPSVTYAEGLEVALRYGWIDSQKRAFDDLLDTEVHAVEATQHLVQDQPRQG